MRTKVNFPIRSRGFARKRGAMLSWGLLITLACLIPPSAPAQFPQSRKARPLSQAAAPYCHLIPMKRASTAPTSTHR